MPHPTDHPCVALQNLHCVKLVQKSIEYPVMSCCYEHQHYLQCSCTGFDAIMLSEYEPIHNCNHYTIHSPAQADLGATAQPGSAAATASAALQALPENIQDRPFLLSITHHDDVVAHLIVVYCFVNCL